MDLPFGRRLGFVPGSVPEAPRYVEHLLVTTAAYKTCTNRTSRLIIVIPRKPDEMD